MPKQKGFTLIELMIVLAVLAALISLAVPLFTQMTANQRTSTLANELTTSLQLARSEAVTRRGNIVICAANANFTGCQAGVTAWNTTGWLILSGALVIKAWQPNEQIQVTALADRLTFTAKGSVAGGGSNFVVRPGTCLAGPDTTVRSINLQLTRLGQINRVQGTC